MITATVITRFHHFRRARIEHAKTMDQLADRVDDKPVIKTELLLAMFLHMPGPPTPPPKKSKTKQLVARLHSPFLYSNPPLPCHPPSDCLRLFSSQTFSSKNTPTFSTPVILRTYLPMKVEWAECSETFTYKIQTMGNYPEESIQHSEQGKSLKSRTSYTSDKYSSQTDQLPFFFKFTGIGKAIPLQAWTGPKGSRRLRLPHFKTIST
jgi:hypothetical protein